ncbi:MAG TPA: hypothetical protein VFQ61_09220 [Polyangiaceae bacterium]|nr:hypothetical protein [Polyangiaceae bacterium]
MTKRLQVIGNGKGIAIAERRLDKPSDATLFAKLAMRDEQAL